MTITGTLAGTFTGKLTVNVDGKPYEAPVSMPLSASVTLVAPPAVTPPVVTPPVVVPPVVTPPVIPPPIGTAQLITRGRSESSGLSPAIGSTPAGTRLSIAPLPVPAVGAWLTDSNFPGVRVRKLVSAAPEADERLINEYPQLQSFSPAGNGVAAQKYILLIKGINKGYAVYDFATMVKVRDGSGWGAPRWIAPTKIVYILGDPYRFVVIDVVTGVETVAVTTPFKYGHVSLVDEEPSFDKRWICGAGHNGYGADLRFFGVDLVNHTLGAMLDPANVNIIAAGAEADWIAPSPSGKYLALQSKAAGAGPGRGLKLYDIQSGVQVRHIHDNPYHSDMGMDAAGREFCATTVIADIPYNNNYPGLQLEWLDGLNPPKHLRMMEWGALNHISAQGPRGQLLLTGAVAEGTGVQKVGIAELAIVDITDGKMQRLWHHRTSYLGPPPPPDSNLDLAYWAQAQGILSPNGDKIIFRSDMGVIGEPMAYLLEATP